MSNALTIILRSTGGALETQAARLFNEHARSDERLQLEEAAQEFDALYEESAERGPTFSESGLHQP